MSKSDVLNLNLSSMEWNKNAKILSAKHPGKFPNTVVVTSKTGNVEVFLKVRIGHPFFDYDQWDGEMYIYVPLNKSCIVSKLVLYHG